jgi:hypothetical protein
LTSLGLALAMHPIQFAVVQFFEGYWGNWALAQRLRSERIVRYQGIHDKWELTRIDASKELQKLSNRASVEVARQKAAVTSRSDEAARILESSLPRAKRDIMPTRLGNVFRRFEREAGRQYSLDAPYFFPHLMLLAPSDHVAYVNDQRSQFDLAIRMSLTGLLASMIAIIFSLVAWSVAADRTRTVCACIPLLQRCHRARPAIRNGREYSRGRESLYGL